MMSSAWLLISMGGLVVGVFAYGLAGAKLHAGSRAEGGALHSGAWWSGTALQGVGFMATFLARRALPVVVVQASSSLGLAVTALLQHRAGVHRLERRAGVAIILVVSGLALISASIEPGPAVPISAAHLWLLAVTTLLAAALALPPLPAWLAGTVSGMSFSYAAIGARLLMGDVAHPIWLLWQLPTVNWLVGILTATGIVLGQFHLTRGLARGAAATVLGPMYAVETVLPAGVGMWLLAEVPRPGAMATLLGGIVIGVLGATWLSTRHVTGAEAVDRH